MELAAESRAGLELMARLQAQKRKVAPIHHTVSMEWFYKQHVLIVEKVKRIIH